MVLIIGLLVGFFDHLDQLLVLLFQVSHSLVIALIWRNGCRFLQFGWISVFTVARLNILVRLGLNCYNFVLGVTEFCPELRIFLLVGFFFGDHSFDDFLELLDLVFELADPFPLGLFSLFVIFLLSGFLTVNLGRGNLGLKLFSKKVNGDELAFLFKQEGFELLILYLGFCWCSDCKCQFLCLLLNYGIL